MAPEKTLLRIWLELFNLCLLVAGALTFVRYLLAPGFPAWSVWLLWIAAFGVPSFTVWVVAMHRDQRDRRHGHGP